MENVLLLPRELALRADPRFGKEIHQRLFESFSHGCCHVRFEKGEELVLSFGACEIPALQKGAEYALSICESGFAVRGGDLLSLARGFCVLLQRIEWERDTGRMFLRSFAVQGCFKLQNRMLHLCVFPETPMFLLQRYVRMAAMLQFTHVVLEFWGMLRYDCCAALSWPQAFSKGEVRELLEEMRALGVSPVPMFNHLGHASACRMNAGKHVVLDQDPSLYALFTPDGWAWEIENLDARALLRAVRGELYELFGESEYFHLGLDESYIHTNDPQRYATLPDYLGELSAEVVSEGRRPMLWMDMFLPPEAFGEMKKLVCAQKTPAECDAVLSRLHPASVLVDWQYDIEVAPVPTTLYLKDKGFSLMGAPWFPAANALAHADTAVSAGLHGVMQTTWHTLARQGYEMLKLARHLGCVGAPWSHSAHYRTEFAALWRCVGLRPCQYTEAGWRTAQITLGSEKEC